MALRGGDAAAVSRGETPDLLELAGMDLKGMGLEVAGEIGPGGGVEAARATPPGHRLGRDDLKLIEAHAPIGGDAPEDVDVWPVGPHRDAALGGVRHGLDAGTRDDAVAGRPAVLVGHHPLGARGHRVHGRPPRGPPPPRRGGPRGQATACGGAACPSPGRGPCSGTVATSTRVGACSRSPAPDGRGSGPSRPRTARAPRAAPRLMRSRGRPSRDARTGRGRPSGEPRVSVWPVMRTARRGSSAVSVSWARRRASRPGAKEAPREKRKAATDGL